MAARAASERKAEQFSRACLRLRRASRYGWGSPLPPLSTHKEPHAVARGAMRTPNTCGAMRRGASSAARPGCDAASPEAPPEPKRPRAAPPAATPAPLLAAPALPPRPTRRAQMRAASAGGGSESEAHPRERQRRDPAQRRILLTLTICRSRKQDLRCAAHDLGAVRRRRLSMRSSPVNGPAPKHNVLCHPTKMSVLSVAVAPKASNSPTALNCEGDKANVCNGRKRSALLHPF